MKKFLILSILFNILAIVAFLYSVKKLGGLNYLRFLFRNQGVPAWYEQRNDLFKSLPIDSSDVVFLGNSITHQGEWSELLGDGKFKNRGISGDVVDRIRYRLPYITKYRPAAIFLMIGINDLLFIPPDEVAQKYQLLVNDIMKQSPSTHLFLQSVLPVNNQVKETHVKNKDIVLLNKKINEIAINSGIVFIDIHTLLKDKEGQLDARYTFDGIHLNAQAYRIWAAKLQSVLGI